MFGHTEYPMASTATISLPVMPLMKFAPTVSTSAFEQLRSTSSDAASQINLTLFSRCRKIVTVVMAAGHAILLRSDLHVLKDCSFIERSDSHVSRPKG